MPRTFTTSWEDEIAEVSGDPEYQNAEIEIRNPAASVVTRDIDAGPSATTSTGDPVVYTRQARVSNTRSNFVVGGSSSIDPTGVKSMIIQIPYEKDLTRIRRGWQVRFTDGGRNDRLKDYLFVVESDVDSSHVASITFNVSIDVESDPNWAP